METGNVVDSKQQTLARLMAEHQQLEARVRELEHHISLTTAEQVEIAQLKKLKLRTKDQLYQLRNA